MKRLNSLTEILGTEKLDLPMHKNDGLFDLTGRTAFVAGACGKIGHAICHALAKQNGTVVVADRKTEDCALLATELQQANGGQHASVSGDLAEENELRNMLKEVEAYGPFHIVVHCLGIISSIPIPGYAVPFPEQSLAAWELAIKINLTSAFLLCKHMHPYLEKKGRTSVIFLSSIYGSHGPNWGLYDGTSMGNPSAYGATKGGLEQLMRYLSTQWAPGIRVNCVAPGGIKHEQPAAFIQRYEEMTPLHRMANPEDVAGPVVFLASDAARYITGHNLMVDGGWTAW